MNDFDARKGLLTLAVISSLVLFQACAGTGGSVGDQMSSINQRFSKLEGQVTQMENRIPAIENRLTSNEKKVAQVETKSEQANAKADQALSSISNLRLEKRLVLDLKGEIVYGFDSAMLTDEGKKSIDVFLSDLKGENNGHQTFIVGGRADSVGTDRYNYNLGRRRADSVAQYLILNKKIDPMQVVIVSFGESSPLTDNKTPEGREKNRSVEIRVYSDVITASSGMTTAQR
jgi:outer membrane protein OmpA-like peptidoglycan-associated protein